MDNKNQDRLKRIFSALELPMKPDESIDYGLLPSLIEYQLGIGVEGFYCMGSSGEALLMSLDERKKALEVILKAVDGRVPVIAHVGTVRTEDVKNLARHASDAGAEIIAYYEDVIRAVPDIGVIVYNIPQFTGVEFNKDNAGRLLANDNVIGVKHTSNNLYSLERMKTAYPDLILFNGFDEQFLASLSMGAEATIGTTVNVFAPLFLKIRECFKNGKMEEALTYQRQLNKYVEEMCRVGIFSAVKYILQKRGIDAGACRRPFHPLTAEERARIDAML